MILFESYNKMTKFYIEINKMTIKNSPPLARSFVSDKFVL